MSDDGCDRAARRKNRGVSPRGSRRHGGLKCAYHTAVVILPTLYARDITLWADPIIENRFDNLLKDFVSVSIAATKSAKRASRSTSKGIINLLVGLNLIKPWV